MSDLRLLGVSLQHAQHHKVRDARTCCVLLPAPSLGWMVHCLALVQIPGQTCASYLDCALPLYPALGRVARVE